MSDASSRRSSGHSRRHVFRLHWRWWILPPVLLGVVQVGLLGLAGTWQQGRMLAWGVFVLLLATAAWVVWSERIRIVVTDDGIRESTAAGDRDFAWAEIRGIEYERDLAMPSPSPSRLEVWQVRCAGGRRLRFSTASIGGARRLAAIIREGIRCHAPRRTG